MAHISLECYFSWSKMLKCKQFLAFEHLLAEKKFTHNCFEHENFITSGPDLLDFHLYCFALYSALIALFLFGVLSGMWRSNWKWCQTNKILTRTCISDNAETLKNFKRFQ